ncbi:MAG TPA: hypothetical protein VIV64_03120 [Gammaproteobacteria bacterium]
MAIYVKYNNGFEQSEPTLRECPHCGVHAPMIPVATPNFAELTEARPQHTGIAFRCAACNEPRFARAAIRSFDADRVVLSSNLIEVERPKEHFQYNYLPVEPARLLREAFGCYAAGLPLAFAVLCRQTIRGAGHDASQGTDGPFEKLFDNACRLAEIDPETRAALHAVLFETNAPPDIDADQAAILIEIIKDMLHQYFVRTAKLRRAIQMRRLFATESDPNVTPIAASPPDKKSSEL